MSEVLIILLHKYCVNFTASMIISKLNVLDGFPKFKHFFLFQNF